MRHTFDRNNNGGHATAAVVTSFRTVTTSSQSAFDTVFAPLSYTYFSAFTPGASSARAGPCTLPGGRPAGAASSSQTKRPSDGLKTSGMRGQDGRHRQQQHDSSRCPVLVSCSTTTSRRRASSAAAASSSADAATTAAMGASGEASSVVSGSVGAVLRVVGGGGDAGGGAEFVEEEGVAGGL